MNRLNDFVILYARHVYGARLLYRNRAIYLKTDDNIYRVDLSMAHKNIYRFHGMRLPIVLTDTCFGRGLFRAAAHGTYKEINLIPTNADWEKFVNDAYAFAVGL